MNALKDLNTIPQPDVLKIVDKIYMNTASINLHVIVKMVINMDLNCKMWVIRYMISSLMMEL
jgi:hypothetical protein